MRIRMTRRTSDACRHSNTHRACLSTLQLHSTTLRWLFSLHPRHPNPNTLLHVVLVPCLSSCLFLNNAIGVLLRVRSEVEYIPTSTYRCGPFLHWALPYTLCCCSKKRDMSGCISRHGIACHGKLVHYTTVLQLLPTGFFLGWWQSTLLTWSRLASGTHVLFRVTVRGFLVALACWS